MVLYCYFCLFFTLPITKVLRTTTHSFRTVLFLSFSFSEFTHEFAEIVLECSPDCLLLLLSINCTFSFCTCILLSMSSQQTDSHNNTTANSPINTELLKLPAPDTSYPSSKLDATGGNSVKLDGLGPMVVNTDGTLSRIANWNQMTDMERERTLRLLSARNKLRLANEERKQQEGDPGADDESIRKPPEVNKT